MQSILRSVLPWRLWPSTLVLGWIKRRSKGSVIGGPFAGMRYVHTSVGSSCEPKLLGTYEAELSRPLRALIQSGFARVVDVGAAEGYYAVGMALVMPEAQVIAFEANPAGQELLSQLADLNGVRDRIVANGRCDVPALQRWLDPALKTLVIMDVEGAEKALLDPELVPELILAHVLVEIHDHADAQIGQVIRERFLPTHTVESIGVSPRQCNDYPIEIPGPIKLALRSALLDAINEHRHPASYWFHMTPREAV